jgi:hypothetical protein
LAITANTCLACDDRTCVWSALPSLLTMFCTIVKLYKEYWIMLNIIIIYNNIIILYAKTTVQQQF